MNGGKTDIITYYAVYYGENSLAEGYSLYDDFQIPFAGAYSLTATSAALLAVLSAYMVF